jgi:hypothetical protein
MRAFGMPGLAHWHKELDEATSIARVVDVVNDYVRGIPTETLADIPVRCWPASVDSEDGIHLWHAVLNAEVAASGLSAIHLRLQDIAVFFLRASKRIYELKDEETSPASTPIPDEKDKAAHH